MSILITISELADQVGLSEGHLRDLERVGVLPRAERIGRGAVRVYDEAAVAEIRQRLATRRGEPAAV